MFFLEIYQAIIFIGSKCHQPDAKPYLRNTYRATAAHSLGQYHGDGWASDALMGL
jgi:hypothetical protein